MSQGPYKRKQGEFELRVLKDGRLVMVAPDETLLEIGQAVTHMDDPTSNTRGSQDAEGTGPADTVPVVIATHPTRQKNMTKALEDMERLDVIHGKPVCIRIVDIPEDKD